MISRLRWRIPWAPPWHSMASLHLRHVRRASAVANPAYVDSEFDNPSHMFLRFTPLSSKRTRGHSDIYTGRPRNSSAFEYYSDLTAVEGLPAKDSLDTETLRSVAHDLHTTPTIFVGGTCRKMILKPGDLVESCTREGKISCAVVLDYVEFPRLARVLAIDAHEPTAMRVNDIRMVFRGLYRSDISSLVLGASVHDTAVNATANATAAKATTALTAHMKLFIRSSLNLASKISPYILSAYAHASKDITAKAVSVPHIAKLTAKFMRTENLPPSPLLFATYLSISVKNLRFYHGSIHSPILALPARSFDAVTKVMHYLTDRELQMYAEQFSQLLVANSWLPDFEHSSEHGQQPLAPEPRITAELAQIISFLLHYIMHPDDRLSAAVRALMARIYPERDSESWLIAPSTALKLLRDCRVLPQTIDHNNPLLDIGSALCLSGEPGVLVDGLEEQFTKALELRPRLAASLYRWTTWDDSRPVFCFASDPEVAFSISRQGDSEILAVHIPIMIDVCESGSPAADILLSRGSSWHQSAAGAFELFPRAVRVNHSFGPGFTKCLTYEVNYRPAHPTLWLTRNSSVTTTVVPPPLFLHDNGTNLVQTAPISGTLSEYTPLNRLNRTLVEDARKLLESLYWNRVENGAVFDAPLLARPYTSQAIEEGSEFRAASMVQELRLSAGRIAALFAQKHDIPVPYVKQAPRLHSAAEKLSFDEIAAERKALGRLFASSAVLAEQYLGSEEVTDVPSAHAGLGVFDGYVHVGNPHDDAVCTVAQWALCAHLPRLQGQTDEVSGLKSRAASAMAYKQQWYDEVVQPQKELLAELYSRVDRFQALLRLEHDLKTSHNYHIFRCRVLDAAAYPDMSRAFCHELQQVVDLVLLPRTSVEVGDAVICTEILELSPIDGLVVLGM